MKIDHDVFRTWNESSAYLLGFWYADGGICISRDGKRLRKKFHLTNTDKQIMIEMMNIIKTKSLKLVKKKEKHHKECFRIVVNSNELFDYCYRLVGSTNKCKSQLRLPNIPDEVFHHFVRGYMDGDGSVHFSQYTNRHGKQARQFSMSFTTGSNNGKFLEQLNDKIMDFVPVSKKKITGKHHRKLKFAQCDSIAICNWLYVDSRVYMERKHEVFRSVDMERASENSKYTIRGHIPRARLLCLQSQSE